MLHHAPLLMTIAVGLVMAFALGFGAQKLNLSPIVGYLAAGIVVGPYTAGYVADGEIAAQLAEIGVILLMFGVGLHFSIKDLLAVRRVALPGAISQMLFATALGTGLGLILGWNVGSSLLFGLALSVASTVVLLRALEERQLLDTRGGHIAVGWLIVEDLAMVIALVAVPVIAADASDPGKLGQELLWTLARVSAFVALMIIVGRRVVPWLLAKVAATGSRELFTLGVLALGIGVAVGAAYLFDVSFALGAFFAGMILKESELAHRAADDSLPMRDAFAVLFFVSVGMLFDWHILLERPLAVVATVLVIVVGKFWVAYGLVRLLRYSRSMSLVIAAALAQIGEFSFILMTMGEELHILDSDAQSLVLAGAIISIVLNPALFAWASRAYRASQESDAGESGVASVVVVGYGRVGARVSRALWDSDVDITVIEDDETRVQAIRDEGHDAVLGNAVRKSAQRAAGVESAEALIIAIPDPLNAGAIIDTAKALNPSIVILARGIRDADVTYLKERGADRVIVGVHEVADIMIDAVTPGGESLTQQ
ncbi:YbaL family putative K(+) efflux transporter [Demequina sp.]|uniref:YbaL family putative K(+) efflux transporter n=1 Tax=Demequina sp. TaxID=2050685 RepID=UPI003D102378